MVVRLYMQINLKLMWPAAAVTTDSCPQVLLEAGCHLAGCALVYTNGSRWLLQARTDSRSRRKDETLVQSSSGFVRAHGAILIASKTVNTALLRLVVLGFVVRSAYAAFNPDVL